MLLIDQSFGQISSGLLPQTGQSTPSFCIYGLLLEQLPRNSPFLRTNILIPIPAITSNRTKTVKTNVGTNDSIFQNYP